MDTDDRVNDKKPLIKDGSKFQFSVHELRKSPVRAAAVCLGLLCVLLLAGLIGQRVSHNKTERDQQIRYKDLAKEKDNTDENLLTALREKRELNGLMKRSQDRKDYLTTLTTRLQTNINRLIKEKSDLKSSQGQLQITNNELKKQTNQLKDSQTLLQNQKDTLSKAIDSAQTKISSVMTERGTLQTTFNTTMKQKDDLQNKCNNLTSSNQQLQDKQNTLVKKVEQLEASYSSVTSEKDKLHSSHLNLTKERDNLQASYDLVVRGRDELKDSVDILADERDQLKINYDNTVQEIQWIKKMLSNLTAEKTNLQNKIETLNSTIKDVTCPANWKKFQNSCYYTLKGSKKTWAESREYCQNQFADLLIINSPEEMEFINGLYPSGKDVWIGLTDEGVEGNWKWVNGKSLTTTYWASGQPNSYNGKDQDCGEFTHRTGRFGDWNDEICDRSQEWICEK
ncbi:C-type lectin domain family 10 member A-like [Myripristis murdjan]|uniref:C-type lectin domain family 10 member A-like n=1 Tax=Myripristis murdjan TaxID=586833 RepID=UPI0011763275|nr:C-type lectin domain family 10 member A-like [Myripristis murdjan]